MAVRDVRPFFVPDEFLIEASPWSRLVDGDWEPLGESVDNWDYRTHVRLRCSMTVDVAEISRQSRLNDGSPIAFYFGWRALDTYLVGRSVRIPLQQTGFDVEIAIDPQFAGASVGITRRLVVERDRLGARAGEAKYAGSVLWGDETGLRLTGSEAMFPTEVVDFEAFGIDKGASWHLRMPSSPDEPAMGALLLLINPLDRKLVAAVQKERNLTDEQTVLVQEMEEDLAEEIVRWALAHWDELDDCDPESFGAVARALANRVLAEPAAWNTEAMVNSSMDLRSAIVAGSRAIGFGRRIT